MLMLTIRLFSKARGVNCVRLLPRSAASSQKRFQFRLPTLPSNTARRLLISFMPFFPRLPMRVRLPQSLDLS